MNKDYLSLLLKSQPESSTLHYKLGIWYRSRGMMNEAAASLEQALTYASRSPEGSKEHTFDEPLCWLEYGKQLRLLGQSSQAAAAFEQCLNHNGYIIEALVEIGDMLYRAGMTEDDLALRLTAIASASIQNHAIPVAEALRLLGAYHAATEIYAASMQLKGWTENNLVHYILCLIYINQFKEALALLSRKAMLQERVLLMTAQHTIRVTEVINVCKCCLYGMNGGNGMPALSRYEALETAKTAIALGKIDEALAILSSPTPHEYNELVYTLYQQGYRELAANRIAEMDQLPLYERSQISLDLCFIAAEIQYDTGKYEEAAAIFEAIYSTDPNHSPARFGAASCYLQQTHQSLISKMESCVIGSETFMKIDRYLSNITRALQILNITQWHTEWTPAQQRNHQATSAAMLH